ncbi:hypothetical protein AMJ83_05245 [candidate division WOR_3 bacterium SM23_42]|uniref:Methionine aminopeptidase n=1 Tax=candidate division WOR_3 bacterium SM23_42 TaxID=1703779 RepID=A0A0S8FT08_UNCW3|nr:MAG: hypothetical protein AMJ83_05245 [candidate division WOR_3 bacterium SM23_42]
MTTSLVKAEATEQIRAAGYIIAEVFKRIEKMDLRGMKTLDLNDRIDTLIRERNATPAFLNYRGFPKSCCISLNNEIVHGIPDLRLVKNGDIVKVDIGVKYGGYIADAARTFPVGNVTPEVLQMLSVTMQALNNGIEAARPGNKVSDISRAIQITVEAKGYSVVRELTGHGVGKHLHEEPVIPNFVGDGPEVSIMPGMALAIEPMVNMGSQDVVTASNGWTVLTRDKSLSCHYEDTILILEDGNINVTRTMEN